MINWIISIPMILMGAYIAFFNCSRHYTIYKDKKAGNYHNISSVPYWGSIFFLGGWYISPLDFNPWMLIIVLLEIGSINFIHDVEEHDNKNESEI